jgi:phosphatidylethanolamine-binding protein (PEBP) family uncharacterized protein
MAILDYIELFLSWLLKNQKHRDDKLFSTRPPFAKLPKPNMKLESVDCGPSGGHLDPEYTQIGSSRFPELTWTLPDDVPSDLVKEYIFVCEDVDAPLPTPVMHSLFFAIPPTTRGITHADIEADQPYVKATNIGTLKNGWKYVPNIRKKQYGAPRPLLGHGEHRYYWFVVALSQPIDIKAITEGGKKVSRDAIAEAINGNVLAWGEWIGIFERKWE